MKRNVEYVPAEIRKEAFDFFCAYEPMKFKKFD